MFGSGKSTMTIKCVFHLPELYLGRIPPHIIQIVYGYQKLAQDGVLNLTFSNDVREQSPFKNHYLVEINKYRVFYDVTDAIGLTLEETDALLGNCDFLFKRSYDPEFAAKLRNREKYLPLGLNYAYYYLYNTQSNIVSKAFALVGRIIRYYTSIKKLAAYTRDVDRFWTVGSVKDPDIDILFMTRLWQNRSQAPERSQLAIRLTHGLALTGAEDSDERAEERIEYARELRRAFGNRRIVCGIADSPFAREICPDLILPRRYTARLYFRNLIRHSKVCVTTTGLWKSNGWKFAEYMSGGKAIVSNPLCYEVPGGLEAGKNYLSFRDKEELVTCCEQLLTDEEVRRRMELRNQWYYLHYVRPDVLVLNTLMKVFEKGFY